MTGASAHFDLCGQLPGPGVTVLEASAGTGKTYTIAGLVTRLVAEGAVPLGEILAVTFTRLATSELQDRIRARLVSAELGLRRLIEMDEPPPAEDSLLRLLAEPGEASPASPAHYLGPVVARRQRLADALSNFDSATITTTHGFCNMVLVALGVWGDVAPGAALLENPHDLVEEVVQDLYARWVRDKGLLPFTPQQALEVGLAAVGTPDSELDPPADRRDESPAGLRRRLAAATRTEVSRRLVDANLLTYDGVLSRLAGALADPVRGRGARRRLGQRYQVVLVDEFQDTDLAQWEIVQRAFGSGGTRLVLIGDPKQAIYAFRGADVYAYLAAASEAPQGNRFTLDRNWRSDACLIDACDALLHPLQLGHPGIVYRRAGPSCARPGPGLHGAPSAQPLRARWLDRNHPPPGYTLGPSKAVPKRRAATLVAEDLADDIVGLLSSGAELSVGAPGPAGTGGDNSPLGAPDLAPPSRRPIAPGDIAVLVRTNEQASLVQETLFDAGVPAVVSGTRSVLSTPAALDWLALLDSLQQPASRPLAAAAALSAFFGRRAEDLAGGDERVWEEVHSRLHEWADVLRRAGVAALFAEACTTEELPKRLLGERQAERRLTDLAHIAELLHGEAARSQLGPAALRVWLARRAEEANGEGNEEEELCRRLDSDSAAVQVLTVHRAKGLEFPVVYCPYLWDAAYRGGNGKPVAYHPPGSFGRKLDVGEKGEPAYDEHFLFFQEESRGEDLRQMYVALSRAKHQLVLWWVPATNAQHSALGRVLLGERDSSGGLGEAHFSLPRDTAVASALADFAGRAPGLVQIEKMGAPAHLRWHAPPPASEPNELRVMPFERDLDTSWRRSSYTSIIAGAYVSSGDAVSSEPEGTSTDDEPTGVPLAQSGSATPTGDSGRAREGRLRSVISPWASVPAGTAVGTFVHSVLQAVDFSSPDLAAALGGAVAARIGMYPGDPADAPTITAGLEAAITTPLGPLTGDASLRDVKRSDSLDELSFELPLAGGDEPSGAVPMTALAEVFSRHVPRDDPLGAYGELLRGPELETVLRGYLTGSLDIVFRLGGTVRYFVADYKTNRLAPSGEALSAWHYRPSALGPEMLGTHYALQALFYLVALHRYLRWRLPGYRPEAHLGGALYLFLRGMTGPDNPTVDGVPCGVFSWSPPAGLVCEVSDLLAGPVPRPGAS